MNYAWLFRIFLSIATRLIPFLIGVRFWKRFKKGEKAFIILLGYDIIGMIIGAFLAYYYHNNIIMSNIYAIVEVYLLSIFYKSYIENNTAKKALSWFPILYGILFIVIAVFYTGIHNDNPSGFAVQALFSIVFGSVALGSLAGEYENLVKQGDFWIIIGLLSFYLINIGYLTMSYWLIETNSSLTMGLFNLLRYSFYVVNMFYALGLWLVANSTKTN